MQLVGFIIRIYDDARSPERRILYRPNKRMLRLKKSLETVEQMYEVEKDLISCTLKWKIINGKSRDVR